MTFLFEATVTMAERVASSDGTGIAYETSGAGPALVFVHGASADRQANPELRAGLETAYSVTAYDRRGRGGSEDNETYDFLKETDDLRAVIAEIGNRPILFGTSMGARIALELLRDPPELLAMVLFEPPATDQADRGFADRLDSVRNIFETDGPEAAVILHSRLFHNRTSEDIARLKDDHDRWRLRVETFPSTLREMEAVHRDCLFDTRNYRQPGFDVHMIVGDQTLPFIRSSAELIASLGFVHVHELKGQDHSAPSSNPQTVLAAFASAVASC